MQKEEQSTPPTVAATRDQRELPAAPLPRWPLVAMFGLYPVWWLLGIVDLLWLPFAVVLLLYLYRRSAVRAPRGFGFWLFFLVWMTFSAIELDSASRLLGFSYRWGLYVAFTLLFLYVYNARPHLSERFLLGLLTLFWGYVVAGGLLGALFPTAEIATPISRLVPEELLTNELVNQMAVRRFSQFNPDAYAYIDPRPSAPFLYTNNWGNAYSLLLPLVVAYLVAVRRERRFWPLVAVAVVSLAPAFLTLNRGMFLGLGVAMVYATVRLGLNRHAKALVALALMGVLGTVTYVALPVQDRLENRLEASASTQSRAALYTEAWEATKESPLFGHGAPRPSAKKGAPSVGTQGQLWMVLYSHGIPAVVGFLGWFLAVILASLRRLDVVGLAASTLVVVGTLELTYYGLLPQGLPLMMIAAALVLRPEDRPHRVQAVPTGDSASATSPAG